MEVNRFFINEFFRHEVGHSTETMMAGMTDDVLTGFDEDKCAVMIFLDLFRHHCRIRHDRHG